VSPYELSYGKGHSDAWVVRTPHTYDEAEPFPFARQAGTGARKQVCNYTGEVIPRGSDKWAVDHVCEIAIWVHLMDAASKALAWKGHRLLWPEEARLACQEVANCPHNLVCVSDNGHKQKTAAFAAMKTTYLSQCTSLPFCNLRDTLHPKAQPPACPAVTPEAWELIIERHVRLGLLMGHQAQLMNTCPGRKLCMWVSRALTNLGGVEFFPPPPPKPRAAAGGGAHSHSGPCSSGSGTYGSSLDGSGVVSYDTTVAEEEVGGAAENKRMRQERINLATSRGFLEAQQEKKAEVAEVRADAAGRAARRGAGPKLRRGGSEKDSQASDEH